MRYVTVVIIDIYVEYVRRVPGITVRKISNNIYVLIGIVFGVCIMYIFEDLITRKIQRKRQLQSVKHAKSFRKKRLIQ